MSPKKFHDFRLGGLGNHHLDLHGVHVDEDFFARNADCLKFILCVLDFVD